MTQTYDAILVVSFGGPEGTDDVIPFLENVLRGRNVPRERMLEVAEHYYQFDGVSPINAQNRQLVKSLGSALQEKGPRLPVYWGNRNWHPLLPDVLQQMKQDGVRRCLAFVTSAFSSYSGCRQYLEDIAGARRQVGQRAPRVDKLRVFYNHPGFIEAMIERVQAAIQPFPMDGRLGAHIVYTAHSIPNTMAEGCDYVSQLNEACRLVSQGLDGGDWTLVFQSRSGPPSQPWLEPDICEYLEAFAEQSASKDVVIVPIGFVSDHLEVVYDLDTEAQQLCDRLGLNIARAQTVGSHPRFVEMIRQLILERTANSEKLAVGIFGPRSDDCPEDCCPLGSLNARADKR